MYQNVTIYQYHVKWIKKKNSTEKWISVTYVKKLTHSDIVISSDYLLSSLNSEKHYFRCRDEST